MSSDHRSTRRLDLLPVSLALFLFLLAACGGPSQSGGDEATGGAAADDAGDTTDAGVMGGGEVITRREVDTTTWIRPGSRVGPVMSGMTRADLVEVFGAEEVVDSEWAIGEGMCLPGATVFPGGPRALHLVWEGDEGSAVSTVRIQEPESPWMLGIGVGIGTTLAEVQRLNGGPFVFAGFGWDYGGWVQSWSEGAIGARISDFELRFEIDNDALQGLGEEVRSALMGDQPVSSDLEGIPAERIRVDRIDVLLGEPPSGEERQCSM